MLFESQIRDFKRRLPWNVNKKRKADMRELMRQKLRIQSAADLKLWSEQVMERIEQLHCFRHARVVMFYYPVHHEVDLRPLLDKYKDEKTILLPVTHHDYIELRQYIGADNLKKGHYGIPTPQTATYHGKPDLVIVPGLAFDKDLVRMGRGKGYYDRFLRKLGKVSKVGVCYDFQIQDSVPWSWHDVRMDKVITPSANYER
jgi:5-formyltetrahydrofolate cyclo-ligase